MNSSASAGAKSGEDHGGGGFVFVGGLGAVAYIVSRVVVVVVGLLRCCAVCRERLGLLVARQTEKRIRLSIRQTAKLSYKQARTLATSR